MKGVNLHSDGRVVASWELPDVDGPAIWDWGFDELREEYEKRGIDLTESDLGFAQMIADQWKVTGPPPGQYYPQQGLGFCLGLYARFARGSRFWASAMGVRSHQ